MDMSHKLINNNLMLLLKILNKLLKHGQKHHFWVILFLNLARQRYMFDLVALLKRDAKVLADLITAEHGKTTPDALGDVQRGL